MANRISGSVSLSGNTGGERDGISQLPDQSWDPVATRRPGPIMKGCERTGRPPAGSPWIAAYR